MGWWLGEEEKQEESTIPYSKCTECGDYKEVSKNILIRQPRRWLPFAMIVESNAISSP